MRGCDGILSRLKQSFSFLGGFLLLATASCVASDQREVSLSRHHSGYICILTKACQSLGMSGSSTPIINGHRSSYSVLMTELSLERGKQQQGECVL